MAKATAPSKETTQEEEELPKTAVRPTIKDQYIQNLESKLAEYVEPDEIAPKQTELPTQQEEDTFKKRYGDLRRHLQQKEGASQKKIDELEKQVKQLTLATQQPMPKTQEEFEAWKNKYPDIATFIEIIADQKASQRAAQLETELGTVKEKLTVTEKEKAFATLKVLVPDLEEVVGSNEYQGWFEDQPVFVQEELNTSDDPHKVAYYINAFKTMQNKPVKKAKDSKLDALDTSTKNTGITPNNSKNTWKYTQSQIQKMSTQEYEAQEAEIIASRNAGLILDDLSKRNTVFD